MDMRKLADGKVFIWMQLLGFERDDPDRGVGRFLNRTGFVPDGAAALLFHPDFFHLHGGMEEEYELPADICAYHGIPFNKERARQPWTNYDLRDLAGNLSAAGSGLYASVMGKVSGNDFHEEWIGGHPEIKRHSRGEPVRPNLCPLKRFRDGTYYEDFFVEQLCRTLVDYGLKGVHLADRFCPNENIYNGDYSSDLVGQFIEHTGFAFPDMVAAGIGNDDEETEAARAAWIWRHAREEWIEFLCWRWEKFFEKLCSRVHAIGKEVMVLGIYCTDPFETKYCLGIDIARIMRAGVDYLTANILPTSCYIALPYSENYFHRYMAIAPTLAAHVRDGHLITMVGVQDATEEWDAMHDAPTMHERELYTSMAYQLAVGAATATGMEGATGSAEVAGAAGRADVENAASAAVGGSRRALEGYFLCLGDGIVREDWDWERERMEIAFSADVERTLTPAMLWSDYAYGNMLREFIRTHRWIPFKLFYELGKAGTMLASCVRSEDLAAYRGTLLVPDFDMLSPEEQAQVAAYDRGPVICTAWGDFDPEAFGIAPTMRFKDRFSRTPLTAFAFGAAPSAELLAAIERHLADDDGKPDLDGDLLDAPEYNFTLIDTMSWCKVTTGFRDALARMLTDLSDCPVTCESPFMAFQLKSGVIRLYIYNDNDVKYKQTFVTVKPRVTDTRTISKFPVLPVRYKDPTNEFIMIHHYAGETKSKQSFQVKLQPGGVTILDVYLEEEALDAEPA